MKQVDKKNMYCEYHLSNVYFNLEIERFISLTIFTLEVNNNIEGEVNNVETSHKKRKSEKFEIPPPHKGKSLVDTVVNNDVETLFQVCLIL